jgi:phosphate starvation-inducible protein PhoH and related proteins
MLAQRLSYSTQIFKASRKCRPLPVKSTKISTGGHIIDIDSAIKEVPKTPSHYKYSQLLQNKDVPLVIATGPAGTGKTLISCAHAIHELLKKRIRKIIITRPTVAVENQELGFLPGNIDQKMMPWMIPIYDSFKEYITIQRLREYIQNEDIEICPLAYIRGRTFHNSWILVDEAQNTTVNQMKTLLTRIGKNSKMVVSGDLDQVDLREVNGLADFLERYKLYCHDKNNFVHATIKHVEFGEDDIMRSEVVKEVLDIYKY